MTRYIWGNIEDDAAERFFLSTGKKGSGLWCASIKEFENYKPPIRNGITQLPEIT
jgi:hypothetical protein